MIARLKQKVKKIAKAYEQREAGADIIMGFVEKIPLKFAIPLLIITGIADILLIFKTKQIVDLTGIGIISVALVCSFLTIFWAVLFANVLNYFDKKQKKQEAKQKLSNEFQIVKIKHHADLTAFERIILTKSGCYMKAKIDENDVIHYQFEQSDGTIFYEGKTQDHSWFFAITSID